MLDKNKKYSFDELKEIYLKASAKAIEKLNKEFSEKTDKTDSMTEFVFSMQNMMCFAELNTILFNEVE